MRVQRNRRAGPTAFDGDLLAAELRDAEQVAIDWANSAGWATGHGDTLADILREMRAQHQKEKGDSSK